jgi:hypothetical protein
MTETTRTIARETILRACQASHPLGMSTTSLRLALREAGITLEPQAVTSEATLLVEQSYLSQRPVALNAAETLYHLTEVGRVALSQI